MRRFHLLLLVAAAFAGTAQAEAPARGSSLRFEHLTIEQGLSQNTVTAILQDRRGYMWLGTEDGLHRYDGYHFTVYRTDPADPETLSGNFITSIAENPDGTLWVGTGSAGLNHLDPVTGDVVRYRQNRDDPRSLSHDRVWAVARDDGGDIWVGTDGGLNRLDAGGGFTHFRRDSDDPDSLASNLVRALLVDHTGRLWIGTRAGLNFIDPEGGRMRRYVASGADAEHFVRAKIQALYEDDAGNLWIGLSNRLARISVARDVTTVFAQPEGGTSTEALIRAIVSDRAGSVWIGTDGGGLRRLPPGSSEFSSHHHDPTNPASIAAEQILAAYEDETGLLWFGTGAGGVSRFNPATEAFAHYRRRGVAATGLPSNTVWSFHEDPDGGLWIATDAGLGYMHPVTGQITSWRMLEGAQDPKSNVTYAVYRDAASRLWVGAENGLYLFDRESGEFEPVDVFSDTEAEDKYGDTVHFIVQDAAGLIWLGTFNGLAKLDPGTGKTQIFTRAGGSLSSDWVMAVAPSAAGLWVGTEGGLDRLDPATGKLLERYQNDPQDPTSLSHDAIQTLTLTRAGELWVGTTAGLNRLGPDGTFTRYTTADGLPSNYIYAVIEDRQGDIWVSSNRGLSRLDPETGDVDSFSVHDGLQSNEFNTGAVHAGASGRLYFGGINGFNRFDPAAIGADPEPPRVAITTVDVMGGAFGGTSAERAPAQLMLSHDENIFTLEFAVFDFKSPSNNRFLYKLDGFDAEWRDAGERNNATYTNLDPGQYVFRVRGANSQGVWSENEGTLPIQIKPPFTRSLTAYTIYLAVGLCLAAVLMRLWNDRVRREHLLRTEQQKRGLAEHLQRFTHGIASTFDAPAVARQLLDSAADLIDFDCAAVYLQDSTEAKLLAARRADDEEHHLFDNLPRRHPEFFADIRASMKARTIDGTELAASGFNPVLPSTSVLRCVPLVSHGKALGVVMIARRFGPRFALQDMSICALLAQQAVVAFENARLFAEVQRLAVTDELTGLYNRRRFFELARQEFNRSLRHDSKLAMVILDADHFKRINDEYGHLTGDRVLRQLARICAAATRSFDVLGRYGGEELIIMLPETGLTTARNVAARIRADVEANVTTSTRGAVQLTVSIGVAARTAGMRDLSALIEAADDALYQAKREGRNRVVTAA
ncbi:MAG: two-component regulator propeller domain-containing protein [Gammaproteobacteria bacterium]